MKMFLIVFIVVTILSEILTAYGIRQDFEEDEKFEDFDMGDMKIILFVVIIGIPFLSFLAAIFICLYILLWKVFVPFTLIIALLMCIIFSKQIKNKIQEIKDLNKESKDK